MTIPGTRVLAVHSAVAPALLQSLLTAADEVVLLVPAGAGDEASLPPALAARVLVHTYSCTEDAVALARKQHGAAPFDAVLAVWEGAVEAASLITEALGLPGCSPDAARAARDKSLAAARFHRAGVPHPRSWTFDATAPDAGGEALEQCAEGRLVVKMPRSTNSQSVMLVRNRSELAEAMAVIRRLYRTGRRDNRLADLYERPDGSAPVLAQEYVGGVELNIDLLLSEDAHAVLGVFEKHPAVGPTFGETHSVHPVSLAEAELRRAVDVAVAATRALGATRGAAHVELRMGERGPVVIEGALRPGGFLTPLAMRRLTGVDPVAALTRLMVAGSLPEVPPVPGDRACLYGAVNVERTGRVVRITGEARARALPGVVLLDVIKKPGDVLVTLPEGTDYHIAAFLVEGGSRSEVEGTAERIRSLLKAELEEATA
ncbi:ATP-grasp domain-containing protein [Streptomyces spongiae]|uniref:ATP-grasp domain-containing protein n=1 Tax=Streptomyces spongiae TaxID=565072 RepID=A0A5N8XD86_9ACTN|nr:ATP-grasp domain-containing protein [Streptomyces spongiae]MPY57144.1 ATP-grasp domain-containing protein [Streptomyces spongiae]